jgi:hypothetical protein
MWFLAKLDNNTTSQKTALLPSCGFNYANSCEQLLSKSTKSVILLREWVRQREDKAFAQLMLIDT